MDCKYVFLVRRPIKKRNMTANLLKKCSSLFEDSMSSDLSGAL